MICIGIQTGKGGTGKTTTAENLAIRLAQLGYDTLALDSDPQSDLTCDLGIDEYDPEVIRVEQLLSGGIDPRNAAIDITPEGAPGRLRLLAASPELVDAHQHIARRGFGDFARLLDAFRDEVDIAIIDTTGSFTPHAHAATLASDFILFTLEPGMKEYRGLGRRLGEIDTLRDQHPETRALPLGVTFVRTPSNSRAMREYRTRLAEQGLHVFTAHSHQQASLQNASQPVLLSQPSSRVAEDYRALTDELLQRVARLAAEPIAA